MPTPEDITAQKERLILLRRTLLHYLKQQAKLGETYTPPVIIHEIFTARTQIRKIKETLSDWGITIEHMPEDEEETLDERAYTNTVRLHPKNLHQPVNKRLLRAMLVERFTLEELELLCAEVEEDLDRDNILIPVSLELVGGTSKNTKVLNLVGYLERRGFLNYLEAAAYRARSENGTSKEV